jgi:hypothetical protein
MEGAAAMSKMLEDPPDVQHFVNEEEAREQISQAILERYWAIAEKWHLSQEQGVALLGGDDPTMTDDAFERYQYVVTIYKGLHVALCDDCADEWMTGPNSGSLFDGGTPLQHALGHGTTGLLEIRNFVYSEVLR